MPKKRSEITQRFAAIIPYDDLENLLEAARKIDEMENKYKRLEEQYLAIRQLYSEILERVAEIDRYL